MSMYTMCHVCTTYDVYMCLMHQHHFYIIHQPAKVTPRTSFIKRA